MMSAVPLSILLALVVLATSVISGIFGMAGGLILMLILGILLPVPTAMVLHGITQLFSNGWRAYLWRAWIDWRIIRLYAAGSLPAAAIPMLLAYVPDKAVMLIVLGLIPYVAVALPKTLALDATKPSHAIACGGAVTGLQLIAGVAGPLLDTFFVKSAMDRRAVVATKAVTQALSHTLKIALFVPLLNTVTTPPLLVIAATTSAAIVGTTLAGPILERLSNEGFRKWTRVILLIVGAISIVQGLLLLVK